MEGLNSNHLRIRKLHDNVYAKGGWYKRWTDSNYSSSVHKSVFLSFMISFVVFQGVQTFFPYLNLFQPREVQSATNSITWTTKADFETATTSSGIDLDANVDSVQSALHSDAQPTGNGLETIKTVYGTTAVARMSTVIDNNNRVHHFINENGTLNHVTNVSGSWVTENVDSTITGTPLLGVLSDNSIVAAYVKAGSWLLANNSSGSWSTETIFSDPMSHADLEVSSTDKVYIAYYDAVNYDYKYVTNNTGSWVKNNIRAWTSENVYTYLSFAIGPGDTLNYCYADPSNLYRFYIQTGGSATTVSRPSGAHISTCKIAVDNSGVKHTAFFDTVNDDLFYANHTTVTSLSSFIFDYKLVIDIALDSNDKAHVVYENSQSNIYEYTNESGSWVNNTLYNMASANVMTNFIMGPYSSSGRYSNGNQYHHISSYVDGSYSDSVQYWNDTPSPYTTPATLGGATADDVSLRADLGTEKAKASTLEWNGTTSSSGQKLLFKVRAGDTQEELDVNQCYGPGTGAVGSGLDDGCADWTTAGKFFSQINGQSDSSTSIDSALPSKRYVEVLVRLESSGDNTPVLNDVTLYYDTLEAPTQEGLYLRMSDGTTALKTYYGSDVLNGTYGGHAYTNETTARVQASGLTCAGCGTSTNIRPEVEVTTMADTDFSSPVFSGTATSGNDYVDITGLEDGEDYQIRVRAIDDQGRVSAWTNYAGDYELGDPDFSVDQQAPTVASFNIDSDAEYASSTSVTLTLDADDTGGSTFGDNEAWLDMRFSNDGSTWSDWEDFAYTKAWTLEPGDGEKNVYVRFRDNAGNISGTWSQTSDDDFNAGTKLEIGASGDSFYLSSDWLSGPIPGIEVYKQDAAGSTKTWKTTSTDCDTPQCSINGGQLDDLVASNAVDFSDYPARDACKTLGGFLPTKDQLVSIYTNRVSYGDNFNESQWYWSSTELSTLGAYYVSFINGSSSGSQKSGTGCLQRCIRTPQGSISGTLESFTKDNTVTQNYGTISWSATIPTETGSDALRFQVASNNDDSTWNYIGPDGTAGTYYTSSGTQLHLSHNDDRYIRYKAYLQTADADYTATVYDVSIEILTATTDSITLDAEAPDAFDLSTPTDGTWQSSDSTPDLSWNASSDENTFKYQLYVDGELDTDDMDSATTTIAPITPLIEANHTWYVKAVDAAGNETQSTSTYNIGYDASAPTVALDPGFTFTASDSNSDNVTLTWNTYADDSGDGSPASTYTVERLKNSIYESGSHTLTSDWSSEDAADYENLGDQTFPFVNNVGETEVDIEQAVKYIYRIKVTDEAGNASAWLISNTGLTSDDIDPTEPTDVVASACDGSAPDPCPDTDPNDGSSNTAGYSMKVTWTASSDTGSGVTGYKIYRRATDDSTAEEDFDVVGYLDVDPPGAPVSTIWYDNDTHNGETYTDTLADIPNTDTKASASDTLNDYVTYYYRVTALDASGNETDVITESGLPPVTTFTNYATARTLDVTDPAVPTNLTVTPVGIDSLGGDPLTQRMDISWGASTDLNNQSRTPNCVADTTGCSIKEYTLQQAQGDIDGPTEGYTTIYTGSATSYTEEGLNEDTYYYYKVMATDKADNTSAYSNSGNSQTKNSQVPTSPTSVTVTAKTGNPNTDSEVGTLVTVQFNGSRITGTSNRVDGYRVYRSTSNFATEAEWLALTPVQTYTDLAIPADTQDGQRSFDDTVPNDATNYYYKVIADGWNDSNSEVVTSSLSAVSPDTLHQGWDTTPDATAPTSPLEVTVKDIHGDGTSMVRNIITWQRLDITLAANLREGSSDFAEYRVYRYTPSTIDSPELIVTYTNLADNYYVDGIPIAESNDDYYYYVVAVDNADTDYKYPSPNQSTVINAVANISENLDPVSINPSIAKPTVDSGPSITDIGVSSATVNWGTNQSCDSLVEYRLKDSDIVKAAGGDRTSPVTSHEVGLVGLEKGEDYEYRVVSRNSLGNIDEIAANTWEEFSTLDFSISNVAVETTTTSATITWETSVNSDSSVEYKRENSSENSKSSGDPVLTKEHSVVVEALRPATSYTYKVRSVTDDNYVADTSFAVFSTKAYDADQFTINPSASEIAEENITATSAKIVWNTAIATDTWVDYGVESGVYNQSAGDDSFNTVHVVELKNLTPGQTYYYRVRGTDVNDIEYTSKEYSFTAVLKPTVTVAKVENVTSYTADIVFNTNVDTEASVMYGNSESFGLQSGTAEQKRNHNIHLKDLEDATTYYYYIEIRDKIGNNYKTAVATFATPIDKEGAKVENLKIDILPMGESDETASVIISWNTNKPTTTKVEYDEGVVSNELAQSTIEDDSLNSSHTVIIKELIPSTTYKFRIAGKDKRENKTESQDYTFVTPAKEKSIWQLILRSIEETFSWTQNVGSFFRRN